MMNSLPRRDFVQQAAATALAAATLMPHVASGSTEQKRVKVGQLGTSHSHAPDKFATLCKLADEFEVVGVVEPNAVRRAEAEKLPAFADAKWMTEEELLNVPGLQVVAVETSVRDLSETATRCIRAGKHLHLEKPGGVTLSAFKQVLHDASQRQLHVQMGYMLRSNPAVKFLMNAVREGWLGKVFEIDAIMSKFSPDEQRHQLAEFTGGGMFELGGHLIDLVVAILGKPDRVSAFTHRTRAPSDILADNQLAVLHYPQGNATVRVSLIEVEGAKRRQFVVCGNAGTIDICPLEPPQLRLALRTSRDGFKKEYQVVKMPTSGGRYDDELKELAAVVRGDRAPAFTSAHDLIVHETLLQASEMPMS
jgi:predicted dehydrogenase